MAYDSERGVVVLFGGGDNPNSPTAVLSDAWEWNVATWTQRTPEAAPPGRAYHAMAYDSARGAMVLFGGALMIGGTSAILYNDTWELQDTFSVIVQQPVSTAAVEGFDAAFGVTAEGSTHFTYQWRKDGVPIPGRRHGVPPHPFGPRGGRRLA